MANERSSDTLVETRPVLSISARILLATLLPMLVIFLVVVFAIGRIIYHSNVRAARERAALATEKSADRAWNILQGFTYSLEFGSLELGQDMQLPGKAPGRPEHLLENLIQANPDAHCAWMILEAGAWDNAERRLVSLVRGKEVHTETIDGALPPENGARLAPLDGRSHFYPVDEGDPSMRPGNGLHGGIGYPIAVNGRVAAVAGLSYRYDDAFAFLTE